MLSNIIDHRNQFKVLVKQKDTLLRDPDMKLFVSSPIEVSIAFQFTFFDSHKKANLGMI